MAYKEDEVKALKKFLADHSSQLQSMGDIRLDAGQTILNLDGFLQTHYTILENTNN